MSFQTADAANFGDFQAARARLIAGLTGGIVPAGPAAVAVAPAPPRFTWGKAGTAAASAFPWAAVFAALAWIAAHLPVAPPAPTPAPVPRPDTVAARLDELGRKVDAGAAATAQLTQVTAQLGYRVTALETRPLPPGPAPNPVPVPPGPGPPPAPVPPGPAPSPQGPFRVVFVAESAAPFSPGQLAVWSSPAVRAYLQAHTVKDQDGAAGFRFWDKDVVVTNENPAWQAAWAAVKPRLGALPQVAVIPGDSLDRLAVLPMPDTEAAALALLQTYGGK